MSQLLPTEWTERTIAYWHQALTDNGLDQLDLRYEKHILLPSDMIEEGWLSPQQTATLWQKTDSAKQTTIDVAIPLLLLRPIRSGKRAQRLIAPLLLHAQLTNEGALLPHPDFYIPWIPPSFLEPTNHDLILGDEEGPLRFRNEIPISDEEAADWPTLIDYAWEMLDYVSDGNWGEILSSSGYELLPESAIIKLANRRSFAVNILNLYDYLLMHQAYPTLLQRYTAPHHPPAYPITRPEEWQEEAKAHLGSFSNQYPLSPSQRTALYHFLRLPENTILSISGPPGTGKTTLLQSIIASQFTAAALAGGDPPVIVVSSTNNQAVTNVLHSLHRSDSLERWLPIESFGLYLVNSPDKQAESTGRGILWTDKKGKGLPKEIESPDFIQDARIIFLNYCSSFFDRPIKHLEEAVTLLHKQLTAVTSIMHQGIDFAYEALAHQVEIQSMEADNGQFISLRQQLQTEITQNRRHLRLYQKLNEKWEQVQETKPWQHRLLPFSPEAKQWSFENNVRFVQKNLAGWGGNPETIEIEKELTRRINIHQQLIDNATAQLNKLQKTNSQLSQQRTAWEEWVSLYGDEEIDLEQLFLIGEQSGESNPASLLNWLDHSWRHELFAIAVHYWEGRWLLEMSGHNKYRTETDEIQEAANRWRRYGMLTPCFVATMHSGPGFFVTKKNEPLIGLIDLLIVDEAGQVSPELSGAMVALAHKALFVGDTQQIEPVWQLSEAVDHRHLFLFGLTNTARDYAQIKGQGIAASSGSAMKMAQFASPYQDGNEQLPRGMHLLEHRRSVPDIIDYCNQLAYNGRLIPVRPAQEQPFFPPLGYLHVEGFMEKVGGSQRNPVEAESLVSWLKSKQFEIEEYYQRPLTDLVAILTPFNAQKQTILAELRRHRVHIDTVGTIHALQGGERPLVLFSPTYTRHTKQRFFFDRSVNMLNVAVSRAQDSFLIFSDMAIFNPKSRAPSGILARHLFLQPDNDLQLHQ